MRLLFLDSFIWAEGEPLGMMQLSALARAQGHRVQLALLTRDPLRAIDAFRPDLLAVSMMSTEARRFGEAFRRLRDRHPDLTIVIGGPHPTFVPGAAGELGADAACVGEGDGAFLDVLARLDAGQGLHGVPNLVTAEGATPVRPLLQDLDSLPFVDRELVYEQSAAMRHFRLRTFYASRGCPYRCTYCFNHAFNAIYRGRGPAVRRRSVDHLLEEMAQVVARYDTRFIKLADDAFVLRADDWLEEFAEKYPRRIGLPFYCLLPPDAADADVVRLLKQAGCHSVMMAIESASERIRREILDRPVSTAQLRAAFRRVHDAGIAINTNTMFGLPTATIADELRSLDLNLEVAPEYACFSILVPFPGTRIHEYCVAHGHLDEGFAAERFTESTQRASMLKTFTAREKRLQRNLVVLGALVVAFPWLRGPLERVLMHLPPNLAFVLAHFLVKHVGYARHIAPMPFSPREALLVGLSQLRAIFRTVREG